MRAGHAYVRTRGAHNSPTVEVVATAPNGERGIVGDTLHTDLASLDVRVRGADGQMLIVTRDGEPAQVIPIAGTDFRTTITATRDASSGPLGTFWRIDTRDAQAYTTIGNPVFLTAAIPQAPPTTPSGPAPEPTRDRLPVTGGIRAPVAWGLLVAAVAAAAWHQIWRSGTGPIR